MVIGTGDPDCLGCLGRVGQAMRGQGWDLTVYNLGVRRETSMQIEQRWRQEGVCRLPPECDRRLVFSFGVNDTTLEDSKLRVNVEDSVAGTRRILGNAKQDYPILMIGPPVIADTEQNQHIAQLSDQYAGLSAELGVPYSSVCQSLMRSPVGCKQPPQAMALIQAQAVTQNWRSSFSIGLLGKLGFLSNFCTSFDRLLPTTGVSVDGVSARHQSS